MSLSVLEAFRESGRLRRSVAASTLVFFANTIFSPAVLAMAQTSAAGHSADPDISLEALPGALAKLRAKVKERRHTVEQTLSGQSGVVDTVSQWLGFAAEPIDMQPLQNLFEQLKSEQTKLQGQLDAIKQHLVDHQLPESIQLRHRQVVEKLESDYSKLQSKFELLSNAEDLEQQDGLLKDIENELEAPQIEPDSRPLDPNQLPWGTPDPSKVRKPAETADQLGQLVGVSLLPQGTWVAANLNGPMPMGIVGGPVPEDLAATKDVQLSDAVKAKAAELGQQPVEIFNWVANNIEFQPSYGSIQGADYTLQSKRGNAFDTASLLIGLLRAANIPARYAYGTIEVPVEQVMNWVGGADTPEAAQQILGQGGIPTVAIVQGGKITHIRMEHVWVEAWVDFLPSRAAKNLVGDSWIPMDASFKQYIYSAGYDLLNQVAVDPEALVADVSAATSQNTQENSVQGMPSGKIDSFLVNYQNQLESYIAAQSADPTVGEVLGEKRVVAKTLEQLAAGLPYQVSVRSNSFSELPDNLRYKLRFTLQNASGGYVGGYYSDSVAYSASLPEIAGKLISVSYKPATDDDKAALLSYYPKVQDGQTFDPNSLPKSVPGYLINVLPELKVGDQVIAGGTSVTIGTDMNHKMELYAPTFGWSKTEALGVAGEYRAVGLDYVGIADSQLNQLKEGIDALRARTSLTQGDQLPDKHELVGLMMQSNILGYFSMNDTMNAIQSKSAGVIEYRLPSYGYFHTTLTPTYSYGVVTSVGFSGVTMDVPYLRGQSFTKNNDDEAWVRYNRVKGFRASFLENWIPEQHFSTEDKPQSGVSAAKLLALANDAGQKIFTLTASNADQLNNVTIDSKSRTEIRNALLAGKEVTVHQAPIVHQGWKGSGYVVLDPTTGAAAYLISGGKNGGGLVDAIMAAVSALLGFVDGSLDYLSKIDKVWFSENLKYLKNLARASTIAGWLGLAAGIVNAINGGATGWNLVGQIMVNIFAFAATMILVAAVAAATGPILGAILGAAIAAGIAMLTSRFSSMYF